MNGPRRDAGEEERVDLEGLTQMVRVEVIVSGDQAATIRDLFRDADARGWTAVAGVSGFGHHGEHRGGLLFNERSSPTWLLTVLPEERAQALVDGVRRVLDEHSGVMFVSETHVSRADYFR